MRALRIIRNDPDFGQTIVALRKDKFCYVTGMVPNSAIESEFVSVAKTSEGNSVKVTANTDLVMLVEGLHESGNGCKHVFFARMDEHKDNLLGFLGGTSIPKEDLEKIVPILFHNKSYTRYQVLGKDGVPCALVYKHEVGIPNFNGSTLWILTKEEYKNLKNPPPTADTTKDKKIPVDEAAAKNALIDEVAAKKYIADFAAAKAKTTKVMAEAVQINADLAIIEADKAKKTADAYSVVATAAQTIYVEAAARLAKTA